MQIALPKKFTRVQRIEAGTQRLALGMIQPVGLDRRRPVIDGRQVEPEAQGIAGLPQALARATGTAKEICRLDRPHEGGLRIAGLL
jgi:hypothetical protein